jgi:hypothetical protein
MKRSESYSKERQSATFPETAVGSDSKVSQLIGLKCELSFEWSGRAADWLDKSRSKRSYTTFEWQLIRSTIAVGGLELWLCWRDGGVHKSEPRGDQ